MASLGQAFGELLPWREPVGAGTSTSVSAGGSNSGSIGGGRAGSGTAAAVVPWGQTVLVTDEVAAAGAFVLYHFIAAALTRGARVALVAHTQTRTHYEAVLRKLGVSKDAIKDMLQIISVTEDERPDGESKADHPAPPKTATGKLASFKASRAVSFADTTVSSLQEVRSVVQDTVMAAGDVKVLIVLEDLCLLQTTQAEHGTDLAAWLAQLRTASATTEECAVVALLHRDLGLEDVPSNGVHLGAFLESSCAAKIKVAPLATGHSRDVHAVVTVDVRSVPGTPIVARSEFHVKLLDGGIRAFRVGTTVI